MAPLVKPSRFRRTEVKGHYSILTAGTLKGVQHAFSANSAGGSAVNAFADGGHIWLGPDAGDSTTIVHEGIHLYAVAHFAASSETLSAGKYGAAVKFVS